VVTLHLSPRPSPLTDPPLPVNDKYLKHEIRNLALAITRMKFRPLVWRNTHPYLVVDRMEDMTSEAKVEAEGDTVDRKVALYGYVRGTQLQPSMKVHLVGAGDFFMKEVRVLLLLLLLVLRAIMC